MPSIISSAPVPRLPPRWCSDCRAAAARRCWDDEHLLLGYKRALREHLLGALQQAAAQLEGLQDLCRDEQAAHAMTLLSADSCDLSVRAGGRLLTGTVRNTEDPLLKALWLLLATRAALTEVKVFLSTV